MTKKKIVDAKKDEDGNISSVRFEGNIGFTGIEKAKEMAKNDKIENANYVNPKNGRDYIRSNPDGKEKNNLDYLADH